MLGKYLCQPFDSCQFSGEGEDQPQDACSWLSFHDAVTVRNSCMQEMLLSILQLQVESRDSSCRGLPFLPVELRFTEMCLRLVFLDLSLLNLFACAYWSIQLLLHYARSAESHLVSQNSDTLKCTALCMIVTLAFHLLFAAWSWSNKKKSRWEHSSRFGERRRHRYPGLTARRRCLARCCQERVPGTSAEAVYSRKYQLQRHPGKKFNTTASCRWVTCQVFKTCICMVSMQM